MSNPNICKSESDVSSSSSWDVIAESENSRSSSLEILSDGEDIDNRVCQIETCETVNNIENTFITIPEEEALSVTDNQEFPLVNSSLETCNTGTSFKTTSASSKHKKTKSKCRNQKIRGGPLSVLAILGSILTITVLTAFCLITPDTGVEKISERTTTNNIPFNSDDPNPSEANNNSTAELLETIDIINMHMNSHRNLTEENDWTDEEMCYIEDGTSNVPQDNHSFDTNLLRRTVPPVVNSNSQPRNQNTDHSRLGLRNVSTSVMKELRGVLMAPNFQLFLCTLMQDICLIRLVKQLEKRAAATSKSQDVSKKPDGKKITATLNKLKLEISKKLNDKKKRRNSKKAKKLKKAVNLTISNLGNHNYIAESTSHLMVKEQIGNGSKMESTLWKDIPNINTENGKSECERRFEELDNKWESAGQSHRLKIQEIKEKFRNELHHIRENEKDFPARKQQMKIIREKYLQKLRLDREKYLNQLKKLRDERHVVLKDICKRKETILDSKDASSGNHALLLPGIYDFQQKLEDVRKRETSGKSSHVTMSFPVLHPLKSMDYPKNYSNSDISKIQGNELTNRYQNHLDKMRNYYRMKNATLERNLEKTLPNSKITNSIEQDAAIITKNESHLSETVPEQIHSESESIKPSLDDTSSDNQFKGKFESKSKMVLKKRQKKRELYDLIFDKNGERIMKTDDAMANRAERNSSPVFQSLTKQDPKGPTKKLFTFKGKL